jgi:replicative DNA helicase
MSENQLLDAELNVIGSLFLEPKLVHAVVEKVDLDAFAVPNNHIVSAIEHIVKGNSQQFKKVGIMTVWGVLKQRKKKVAQKYIRDVISRVVTTEDFEDSINIVADAAVRRKMDNALRSIKIQIDAHEDLDNIISNVDLMRRETNQQVARFTDQPTMSDHVQRTDAQIQRIIANRGEMTGIPSGFPRLDYFTGGFQKELIIIGGRPSMGKTAFALEVCKRAAQYYGYKPGFFSYETAIESLLMRMICSDAQVSSHHLKHGGITDSEKERLNKYLKVYKQMDMYIDDNQYSIDVLVSKIETVKEQHNIDFVVVDYLQLIPVKGRTREEEISYISRTLKGTVMRLGLPIIAISQLSRRSARKGGAPPTLDDLRESGALEQDADVVIFPHRPFYYGIRKKDGKNMVNVAEIHIAKHRNGPIGMAELVWNQPFASFHNPAGRWSSVRGHVKA